MQDGFAKSDLINDTIDGDLLDRHNFINQVRNIIEMLSAQKKNSCFSINGGWGVGKSFVLDALEKQLEDIQDEKTSDNKYLVFHYNCWQYDYYEEPIVAIVASILDSIDEKTHLLSDDCKTKLKGVLKAIGNGLLHKVADLVQEKTGVNAEEIIKVVKEGCEEAAERIENKYAYDVNFIFKQALELLQKEIKQLAEYQTIIFVVDELDRCLPQYSIKVLERLHHIFSDVSNVQVIMSIDKKQLSHTIEQIFGNDTDVDKYLAKFIKFEINLDNGSLNSLFDENFAYYLNQFDYPDCVTANFIDVDEFKYNIFRGIDIRSCIEIIDKCNLLHGMLNDVNKKRVCIYMCVEIFLVLLKHFKVSESNIYELQNSDGLKEFIEKLNSVYSEKYVDNYANSTKAIIDCSNVYGVLLACYRKMILNCDDWQISEGYDIIQYAIEFWKLLQIIN